MEPLVKSLIGVGFFAVSGCFTAGLFADEINTYKVAWNNEKGVYEKTYLDTSKYQSFYKTAKEKKKEYIGHDEKKITDILIDMTHEELEQIWKQLKKDQTETLGTSDADYQSVRKVASEIAFRCEYWAEGKHNSSSDINYEKFEKFCTLDLDSVSWDADATT
ncbi:hypothetical protein MHSWG343_07970 [Candidatus Mycoplasma haematohominis]|uniref:Lipoprotein n=1 Tax=Candidatus Mycoplasma haematohominis TaxID=1494318 RepID=A0A478FUR5_9MOLU|nr:hypothetical protein MHSWG343_07970 [Candidatus Mycoplasma haemohominis]